MRCIELHGGQRFWFTDRAPRVNPRELQVAQVAMYSYAIQTPRSPGWEAIERKYIANHPYCAACGEISYLQVHHKLPFHLSPENELNSDNLITLCMANARNCHFNVGHCFDWHAFNSTVVNDAALMSLRIKSRQYAIQPA
jgi:5-methylcytosine-specific restriction enzyme A